jgi:hypothetical protein
MLAGFQYAASQAVGITLNGLATSATVGRQSTAVDNTTNPFMDVILQVRFRLLAGTPITDQSVYVYVYGSEDGVNFTDGMASTDAALTPRVPTNMTLLQTISAATAGGLQWQGNPISVALAFGGLLPRKWGVYIRNYTGFAFTATAGENVVSYTGINILNQ